MKVYHPAKLLKRSSVLYRHFCKMKVLFLMDKKNPGEFWTMLSGLSIWGAHWILEPCSEWTWHNMTIEKKKGRYVWKESDWRHVSVDRHRSETKIGILSAAKKGTCRQKPNFISSISENPNAVQNHNIKWWSWMGRRKKLTARIRSSQRYIRKTQNRHPIENPGPHDMNNIGRCQMKPLHDSAQKVYLTRLELGWLQAAMHGFPWLTYWSLISFKLIQL